MVFLNAYGYVQPSRFFTDNRFLKIGILSLLTLTFFSSAAQAGDMGAVIDNTVNAVKTVPGALSGFSYLLGLVLSIWAVFKFKDHVDNPGQAPLSEGVKRILAGGMFLALPMAIDATSNFLGLGIGSVSMGGSNGGGGGCCSLDSVAVSVMANIGGPLMRLLSGFSYLAGILLVLVGINRLTKSTQEGARGPAGIGTLMTFVTASALMTIPGMMGAFSESMFGSSRVATFAVLEDPIAKGLSGDERKRVASVIEACLGFMAFVGWVAFLRGWFVLKSVADGGSQVSIMQAFTFLFGGALAVNLGPLINAMSETLGIAVAGVSFK